MNSRDFAYWLQGFFEVSEAQTLNEKQVETIKNHLNLVFYHEIDPSFSKDEAEQQEMNNIHKPPQYPLNAIKIGGTDANGNVMRC